MQAGSDTPMDYIRAVDAYLHQPEFRYDERPPAAGRRGAAGLLHQRVPHSGYCQHYAGAMALMLRMGGLRRASRPASARRLLRAQEGLDRPRHRRPCLGRGLVRPFGWVTLDPTPSATPARSAGGDAGGAGLLAPPSPTAVTTPPTPVPTTGEPPRPSARTCRSAPTARQRRRRRQRWRWLLWFAVASWPWRWCSRCVLSSAARGQDADGPRDRGGRGRDAPRRPARIDGHDAGPAGAPAGSHSPEVAAYLRRWRRAATRRSGRRLARAGGGRCGGRWRRASGSAGGCARCGRCRRGSRVAARAARDVRGRDERADRAARAAQRERRSRACRRARQANRRESPRPQAA